MKFIAVLLSVLLSSLVAFALAATDLNTATEAELEKLPGVGPATAQQIIANRPYNSVDDLETKVKGIGPGKLARIRPLVQVSGTTSGASSGASTSTSSSTGNMQPAQGASNTAPAAPAANPMNAPANAPSNMANTAQPARPMHMAAGKLAPGQTVNINTASVQELEKIPGIGPAKAQSIVASRPFASVDDLTKVKGIKGATLAKIRPYVTVQ